MDKLTELFDKIKGHLPANTASLLNFVLLVILLLTGGGDTIPPAIGEETPVSGSIVVSGVAVKTDCVLYSAPVVGDNGDLSFICLSTTPPSTPTPTTPTPAGPPTSIPTATIRPTRTVIPLPATATAIPSVTAIWTPSGPPTGTPSPTVPTPAGPPSATPVNTPAGPGPTPGTPVANAPACPTHDDTAFHDLWDAERGCHYTHDHAGFSNHQWVIDTWGDYTQHTLGQEVSYPWQTMSAHGWENDVKHEGYAFDSIDLRPDYPCTPQFDNRYGVSAYFVESHNLATAIEYGGRVHSFFAMLVLCDTEDPNYVGKVIGGGHADFGQLVTPYQGYIIPKSNTPLPAYESPKPPYFTLDCLGLVEPCRGRVVGNSTWSSVNQSGGLSGIVSNHLMFGFRQQDVYIYMREEDVTNPDPQFILFCDDGNGAYQPIGCENNGSTYQTYTTVYNPNRLWDGLAGFDEDGVVNGFITYHGFGDLQGNPNPECHEVGEACTPLILENVPAQQASVNLFTVDQERFQPFDLPSYDVCFLADGTHVDCKADDAIPSGWIGPAN